MCLLCPKKRKEQKVYCTKAKMPSELPGFADAAVLVSTLAGGGAAFGDIDAGGTSARFFMPYALVLDGSGSTMYVADRSNDKVRSIVVQTGAVSTLAGSGSSGSADGPGGVASFFKPSGLAITPDGSMLYVCDSWNSKIRSVSTATGCHGGGRGHARLDRRHRHRRLL
jgi:sugar lactone lactonase YvrE